LFATIMHLQRLCRSITIAESASSLFFETLTGFHGPSPHGSAVASSLPHSPHRVHYQPPRKLSGE
jgi:hypothetical protein